MQDSVNVAWYPSLAAADSSHSPRGHAANSTRQYRRNSYSDKNVRSGARGSSTGRMPHKYT
eukprot:4768166-Pyramimonas_sp.AAC.1